MMNERLKKQIMAVFEELFLPVLMVTWAVGLGIVSFFLVISVLWELFSFF